LQDINDVVKRRRLILKIKKILAKVFKDTLSVLVGVVSVLAFMMILYYIRQVIRGIW